MNTKPSMSQRLAELIEHTKLTPTAFARSIKVSQPTIALILGGNRGGISVNLAEKITNRYNWVSTDWLLFGRGEMLRAPDAEKKISPMSVNETGEVYESRLDVLERRLEDLAKEVKALKGRG